MIITKQTIENKITFLNEKKQILQTKEAEIEEELKSISAQTKEIEPKQENKEEKRIQVKSTIEENFQHYLESLIDITNYRIKEAKNGHVTISFTIKESDLRTFKIPKVLDSTKHSQAIKKGIELAKKEGRIGGSRKGQTKERHDKKPLMEQIKRLSFSFGGEMNNRELAKFLNCSLKRIINYKKEIKMLME